MSKMVKKKTQELQKRDGNFTKSKPSPFSGILEGYMQMIY